MQGRVRLTPLGAVLRGALAGAVGTLAMDLLWYRRYKRQGGDSGFVAWETSAGLANWEDAPAPAQVGKRLVEGVFDRDLPPTRARLVNNVVHWATGVGWGALFGLISGSVSRRPLWRGPGFGAGVWLQSYAVLAPAKLYEPIWRYELKTLAKDLSAHLVYGSATDIAFRLVATL
ncbi:hypothetical protein JMUB5695_04111 [Mycobacterium heckeshornense]|uniref:hypothetical protein n=1 Tax=Mycobacterium heckeshornense TaxID=110505 RepID=UPI00194059DB|nr:hypothetical protein [Mycobacterium heckeshornense]BCQ10652.1 hypothetical protein JMUB5695_04111 [Mycobacterium heckeshornense]